MACQVEGTQTFIPEVSELLIALSMVPTVAQSLLSLDREATKDALVNTLKSIQTPSCSSCIISPQT